MSELGTISYASLGICKEGETKQGSDIALPVDPSEPEEEEWHIQLDGVAATHSGTGELREAPKPMIGDPDREPPQGRWRRNRKIVDAIVKNKIDGTRSG